MGNKIGFCNRRSEPPEEHPGPVIESPQVPFKHVIPGGIFNGRLVRVRGYLKDELKHLVLKLQCGYYDDSNVALLLEFRPEDNFIVIYAIDKGVSSEGVAVGPVPLHRAQPFEIFIICEQNAFNVVINDMFSCHFPHILPIDDITYIAGDGDMRITLISFESVKFRTSQVATPNSESSPKTAVSNQNISQSSGIRPLYQYSRESYDPSTQVRLESASQHLRNPQQQTNVQQQAADTPGNTAIAQTQRPGISPAPFVLSMAGNMPSEPSNSIPPASQPGTGTNVER